LDEKNGELGDDNLVLSVWGDERTQSGVKFRDLKERVAEYAADCRALEFERGSQNRT
jgi:hypothetical protein